MFITANPDDGLIPHHRNIIKAHQSNPLTQQLDTLGAIYGGGYAMALLLAPRVPGCPNTVKPNYYSDYDLYARSPDDLNRLLGDARAMFLVTATDVVETQKAISFKVPVENGHQNVQIIKLHTGNPEEILSRYDFVNCAIAYDPVNSSISMHQQALVAHLNETLEILNPWMLNEISDETTRNVVIQLIRFKKYCYRWDYTIGERAFSLLMDIYQRYPDIKIEKDVRYGTGSGGETPVFGKKNQNVWEAMACLFKQYSDWSDDLDTIGHINRGSEEFVAREQMFDLEAEREHSANLILDQLEVPRANTAEPIDGLVAAAFGPRGVNPTLFDLETINERYHLTDRRSYMPLDPAQTEPVPPRYGFLARMSGLSQRTFTGVVTDTDITATTSPPLLNVTIREVVEIRPGRRPETVNGWRGTIHEGMLNDILDELRRSGIEEQHITVQHHQDSGTGIGYITRYPMLNTMMQRMGLAPRD